MQMLALKVTERRGPELVDRPLALDQAISIARDHGLKLRELALPVEFFVISLATILGAWRKAGEAAWLTAAEGRALRIRRSWRVTAAYPPRMQPTGLVIEDLARSRRSTQAPHSAYRQKCSASST
jgi:hypothetical protein